MNTELEEAFYRYMETVVSGLASERKRHSTTLAAYPAFETTLLGRILQLLESGNEFKSLTEATKTVAPPDFSEYRREEAAKIFFRRSGMYDQLSTGCVPDIAPALALYAAAFSRTTKRVAAEE